MQHPTTPQDADWRAVYALRSLPRALYYTPFITTNTVGSALADIVPACCTPRQPFMHLQRMVLIPSKFGMMPHKTFGGVAVDYTLKHEPLGGHLEVQALNSAALLLTFNINRRLIFDEPRCPATVSIAQKQQQQRAVLPGAIRASNIDAAAPANCQALLHCTALLLAGAPMIVTLWWSGGALKFDQAFHLYQKQQPQVAFWPFPTANLLNLGPEPFTLAALLHASAQTYHRP